MKKLVALLFAAMLSACAAPLPLVDTPKGVACLNRAQDHADRVTPAGPNPEYLMVRYGNLQDEYAGCMAK